jgi:chromosome segregation ATPase
MTDQTTIESMAEEYAHQPHYEDFDLDFIQAVFKAGAKAQAALSAAEIAELKDEVQEWKATNKLNCLKYEETIAAKDAQIIQLRERWNDCAKNSQDGIQAIQKLQAEIALSKKILSDTIKNNVELVDMLQSQLASQAAKAEKLVEALEDAGEGYSNAVVWTSSFSIGYVKDRLKVINEALKAWRSE